MEDARDLYAVLGVDRRSSRQEIREAFKREVLARHPDKGGTARDFRAVLLAFRTLSCRATRKAYDQRLTRSQPGGATRVGLKRSRREASKQPCETRTSPSMDPSSDGTTGSSSTAGFRLAALGAGTPVKKLTVGGQAPTAVLLRALRRLQVFLAVQPAELRRHYIQGLSERLRGVLLAFTQRNPALRSCAAGAAPPQQRRIHVPCGIR